MKENDNIFYQNRELFTDFHDELVIDYVQVREGQLKLLNQQETSSFDLLLLFRPPRYTMEKCPFTMQFQYVFFLCSIQIADLSLH